MMSAPAGPSPGLAPCPREGIGLRGRVTRTLGLSQAQTDPGSGGPGPRKPALPGLHGLSLLVHSIDLSEDIDDPDAL